MIRTIHFRLPGQEKPLWAMLFKLIPNLQNSAVIWRSGEEGEGTLNVKALGQVGAWKFEQ